MFNCSLPGSVSGRSYVESQHLGRVPMQCVENEETVTINARERGEPGAAGEMEENDN